MKRSWVTPLVGAMVAVSVAFAGCGGSNAERQDDEKPTAKRAKKKRVADDGDAEGDGEDEKGGASGRGGERAEAPPRKMHGPKKRIGIVDFENASHYSWGGGRDAIAVAARDAATEALVKSGAFVVIEREQIAAVLKEQHLGMTGAISPQTAAKAGKLLGLQAIITGKVTDFAADTRTEGFGSFYRSTKKSFHARVSLRVIDAQSGEIWIAESGEGVANTENTSVMGGGNSSVDNTLGKRALYLAVHHMINKLLAKSDGKPWVGAVAKVAKGGKVYITAGSDINLPVGSTLVVRRQGEEITDPATGQVIGHEVGKTIGSLQVAEHLNEKLSVCISTKGAGFATSDLVMLDATKTAPPPATADPND